MDKYTFGRKQKKFQWRENLPIILTVVCVVGIVYGVINLIVGQMEPEAEPVSTITVTRNTPGASELNLSAPLVDYNPNKDKCQEEKYDSETDKDREKRLEECKKEKEEAEKKKQEEELANEQTTEVLGEQAEKIDFVKVLARVIGTSAARNSENQASENNNSGAKTELLSGGSADSSQDKVDDSVRKNTDN